MPHLPLMFAIPQRDLGLISLKRCTSPGKAGAGGRPNTPSETRTATAHPAAYARVCDRPARLTLLRIEVGEVAIREDGSELVAQGQIGTAFGEGGLRDADGLLGHGRDRVLRVERHDRVSSSISPPTPLRSVRPTHSPTVSGRLREW